MQNKEFLPRFGTFFLLIGLGLLLFFVSSVSAKAANFNYFYLAAASLFLAWLFRRRAAPPPPSGRFAALNKARENTRQRRETRRQKQDQKKDQKK